MKKTRKLIRYNLGKVETEMVGKLFSNFVLNQSKLLWNKERKLTTLYLAVSLSFGTDL